METIGSFQMRWIKALASCAVYFALACANLPAQTSGITRFSDVVTHLEAKVAPETLGPGQTGVLTISFDVAKGWHTYPTVQVDPAAESSINVFRFPNTADVIFVGEIKEPKFEVKAEAGVKEFREVQGHAVWEKTFIVRPDAVAGAKKIKMTATILVCNDRGSCLTPQKKELELALSVANAKPSPVAEKYRAEFEKTLRGLAANKPADDDPPYDPFNQDKPPYWQAEKKVAPTTNGITLPPTPNPDDAAKPTASAKNPSVEPSNKVGTLSQPTAEAYQKDMRELAERFVEEAPPESGVLGFVLAGIFWGAVSLITPCVFPMIPITVSFFLKQSEKQNHRPLTMAAVYCATIVVVMTLAALLLLSFFRSLSINPYMNFAMGALFVAFALSLFGMYEIELPAGLAQFTSAREGQGGLIGTMFMALTFTILSFACVAPFLGGFGGTAGTGNLSWFARALGALAFAATFASPFFLLALFPSLLKKMPKSGTWLNSVKVVMGFLELAAALKFFRLGEVVLHTPTLFTYDFCLAIWVAICLLCGLYLLNFYKLPHDTPLENLGVPRLLMSMLFLGLGFYMLPALFKYDADGEKQRPSGAIYAWIDSFLLPDSVQGKGALAWSGDLKSAVEEALDDRRKTGQPKLLFVDVTGKS